VIKSDFKSVWPNASYIDIDGIRMDLPDRMAIVRGSQNGPYIGIKFEAKNHSDYDLVKTQLRQILKNHSAINWSEGVNTTPSINWSILICQYDSQTYHF